MALHIRQCCRRDVSIHFKCGWDTRGTHDNGNRERRAGNRHHKLPIIRQAASASLISMSEADLCLVVIERLFRSTLLFLPPNWQPLFSSGQQVTRAARSARSKQCERRASARQIDRRVTEQRSDGRGPHVLAVGISGTEGAIQRRTPGHPGKAAPGTAGQSGSPR